MTFTVVYDACVLYPAPLRDLLLRIGMTGVVQARWSEQILEECFRNIRAQRPDLKSDNLERTRRLMNTALPGCLVSGHEPLIEGLSLPDHSDRHVLAAAIRTRAQSVVTFNLTDFPTKALRPYGIEALHPDDFVLDLMEHAEGAICAAVSKQLAALRNPPMTMSQLLDGFHMQGLVGSAAKLKAIFLA